VEIIQEAIDALNPETDEAYKDDVEEEKKRREKDKADIAEAINKQMTVGALLKARRSNTAEAENGADPTTPASTDDNVPPRPATPPPGQIPTVQSPNTAEGFPGQLTCSCFRLQLHFTRRCLYSELCTDILSLFLASRGVVGRYLRLRILDV
jgi:hypothetical protein